MEFWHTFTLVLFVWICDYYLSVCVSFTSKNFSVACGSCKMLLSMSFLSYQILQTFTGIVQDKRE